MKFQALALSAITSSVSAFMVPYQTPRGMGALEMARTPFISGNWKLNPKSRAEAVDLASDIAASITDSSPDSDVALFVPYVYIEAAQKAVEGSSVIIGAEVRVLFLH